MVLLKFLRMMNKRRCFFLLCLFALFGHSAVAQAFGWQAQVGPVDEPGYYRVLLPAQVTGRLQPAAADLRLYHSAGHEVPYLLRTERPAQFSRLPVQTFTHTDSAKKTLLRLTFGQPVYPAQVVFYISGPELYRRTGKVVLGQKRVYERRRRKRRRRSRLQETSVPLLLQSNAPTNVELPRQKVEQLLIQLENADNPPLTIDSVQVLEENRYLVANLEADQLYFLQFGAENADGPAYDLAYFRDSVPQNRPVILVRNVQPRQAPEKKTSSKGSTALI